MNESKLIWDLNYIRENTQESVQLWQETLSQLPGKTLFIVGVGFDSRMFEGIQVLFGDTPVDSQNIHCIGVRGAAKANDEKLIDAEAHNVSEIKRLFQNQYREIEYSSKKASTSICIAMKDEKEFITSFDHVIVDVSAMPRITFLTIVPQLITMLRREKHSAGASYNLLVMATENIQFDENCEEKVTSNEASFLHQFNGGSIITNAELLPGVWFPVLGNSREEELLIIYKKIEKNMSDSAVVPILPFPSNNPRRSDDILERFRKQLFDVLDVKYGNLLFASERNPFELYRRLMKSFVKYAKNLRHLGGGRFYVSPLSGKLMSVGAILACYEAQERLEVFIDEKQNTAVAEQRFFVGVPLVEPLAYDVSNIEEEREQSELSMLWLLGDAYND
jgi:hypothetical protein